MLEAKGERAACRHTVALLSLAHERTCEAELAKAIESCLEDGALPDPAVLAARFAPRQGALPQVRVELGSLADYDVLLSAPASNASAAPAGDGS